MRNQNFIVKYPRQLKYIVSDLFTGLYIYTLNTYLGIYTLVISKDEVGGSNAKSELQLFAVRL